ncbi:MULTISPECIES: RNase A-like domain-containing protein [unclassified Microcoleus]|uniref:RNase A-like domain-containing protein n=1 Tax=unclassified Microcoleus TaxID=2642155 RepID=UPI002FD11DFF
MRTQFDRLKQFLGIIGAIASITILFQSAIPDVYATVIGSEISSIPQTTLAFVPSIPGGGLDVHEAAGGHTLERHVGKTEAQLAQRLASERRISAASSFTDRSVAEAAIAEAMNRNQSAIDSWVKSRGNRYTIDYNANRIIGITLRRRASKATSASRLKIVLQRSAKLPPGYFILTAYPE